MDKLHTLYNFLDLAGTLVFAISGAVAAQQRGLDLFGICVIAFVVACSGGIIRDLCIETIPPAGLTNWHYLVATASPHVLGKTGSGKYIAAKFIQCHQTMVCHTASLRPYAFR